MEREGRKERKKERKYKERMPQPSKYLNATNFHISYPIFVDLQPLHYLQRRKGQQNRRVVQNKLKEINQLS